MAGTWPRPTASGPCRAIPAATTGIRPPSWTHSLTRSDGSPPASARNATASSERSDSVDLILDLTLSCIRKIAGPFHLEVWVTRGFESQLRAYQPSRIAGRVSKPRVGVVQVSHGPFHQYTNYTAVFLALLPMLRRQPAVETAASTKAAFQIHIVEADVIDEGHRLNMRFGPLEERHELMPCVVR